MNKRCNVLIIVSDSLRPDYLGCYGNTTIRSENIDSLANQGVLFKTVYAEYPITTPSRTAMVSSIYTYSHRPWIPLRETDSHIAEIFKGEGYSTAAFSNSPFSVRDNMNRGFDDFRHYALKGWETPRPPKHYDFPDLSRVDPKLQGSRRLYNWYVVHVERRLYASEKGTLAEDSPEYLTNEAIKWLKKDSGKPFFLWLDYFDPHEPWSPPSPYKEMYDADYEGRLFPIPRGPLCDYMTEAELNHTKASYKGCITQIDDQIGIITETLDNLGFAENTLVVFTSDHGMPLGDHGTIRKDGVPMWDELTRIPLIFKGPMIPQGKTVSSLAQNTDLAQTLLNLLDIEHDAFRGSWEGVNLTPLITGEEEELRDKAYMGCFRRGPFKPLSDGPLRFNLRVAIRTKEFKFINNCESGILGFPKRNELYNMRRDPLEQKNLIEDEKDLVDELQSELLEFTDLSFYRNMFVSMFMYARKRYNRQE